MIVRVQVSPPILFIVVPVSSNGRILGSGPKDEVQVLTPELFIPNRLIGRTTDFDSVNGFGSNPPSVVWGYRLVG